MLVFVAASALCACSGGRGNAEHASSASADQRKLDEIVQRFVAEGAPGALGVLRRNADVIRAAKGVADRDHRDLLRPTDRFRVASVTKTFVATIVLQLVAERRLRLDDSVDRWLPGVVPNGGTITLRQLLNHTSGLFDFDDDGAWIKQRFADPGREWPPRELVSVATAHPPLFAPGTSWSYSNTNYVLLGMVVEAATSKPLERALQERVFDPLELTSTSYPPHTEIEGRVAHGYVGRGSGLPVPPDALVDSTTALSPSGWGAGQIVSDADDVTTFYAALLAGRLLPHRLLTEMETAVPARAYGMGIRIMSTPCGTAFGHDGDYPGYRNIVWATADGKRVISIMLNIDTTHVPWSEIESSAQAVLCAGDRTK